MYYTLLRAFHAVALQGSFSAAARALNLSQSTLSTQVKGLEARYGVELFHRHAQGARLTDAGSRLFAATQRMLAIERDAYELLSAMGGLRIGHLAVSAVGPYQLSEILARFNVLFPHLEVSVAFGNSREAQADVLSYRADAAVLGTVEKHPQLYAIEYSRPRIVVVVNKGHPLAGRRSIGIEELAGERLIRREVGSETRRTFEDALAKAGVRVNFAMEIGSREGLLAAVVQGIGIGAVSEEEVVPHPALKALPVSNARISTSVHVACLAERKDSHLIRPFLRVVEELIDARREAAGAGGSGLDSSPPGV